MKNRLKEIIKKKKHEVQIKTLTAFPNIETEAVISVGSACRPAYWLKEYKLSPQALPFDWMMNYSFDTVIDTIVNGVGKWFCHYEENAERRKVHRYVQDLDSGMVSMHHFSSDKKIAEQLNDFRTTFARRAQRLKDMLVARRKICFVCNRKNKVEDFEEFLLKMGKLFKQNKFVLINIHDDESKTSIYKYKINKRLTIYEVFGRDDRAGGNAEKNPKAWVGNKTLWRSVMSHIKLVEVAHKRRFWFWK